MGGKKKYIEMFGSFTEAFNCVSLFDCGHQIVGNIVLPICFLRFIFRPVDGRIYITALFSDHIL